MSRRILVVDDNPVNVRLASALLETAGFQVERAFDAESALVLARRDPPDGMLLDLQLPGMDGLTLVRVVRGDPALRNIALIAFSAHAMRPDIDRALSAGCDGYITKPIDPVRFSLQVETLILRPGRSSETKA